jgi:hypothetical protein
VGNTWRISGHTNVSDGQWHHVGYTLSSASAGTLQFYLDGAPDGSAITSAGSHNGSGSGIRMGSDSLSQFDFNGEMDEARFYTRALTTAEVAALYASSAKRSLSGFSNQNRLVTNGLSVFWAFGESDVSGTTVSDRSGNSNNGTLTNGPTLGSARVGKAIDLDGTDDRVVTIENPTGLGYGTGDFSWFAWIYPRRINDSYEMIWSQGTGGIPYFAVRDDTLHFYISTVYETAAGYIIKDAWQHVGVVRSGGVVTMYKNGVPYTTSATQDGSISAPQYAYVSSYGSGGAHAFKGLIDEVRIYNRALSQREIDQIFHGGRGGLNTSQSLVASNSLVNWHTFDGPKLTSSTSTDSSGQGRDGSLSGGMRKTIGKIGQAMAFRGIGETITIAGGGGLNNVSEGSIAMWVKWSGTQDSAYGVYGPALSRQNNGVFTNNIIGLDGADPSTAKVTWGFTGYSPVITGATAVGDNTWRHVVITFTSGDHKLYLDGGEDGTSGTTGSTSNNSGVPLTIGGWPGDGNKYIAGAIDDFRVYNRVLTPAEVLQLYSLTK